MATKFEAAFAAARKSGKKTFSFGGKSYNTKTAPSTPKSGPTPSAAPRTGQDKGSGGRPTSATQAAPKANDRMKARDAQQMSAQKEKLNQRKKADYPQPAKDVGIAKAKSRIGQAAARQANKPK